MAHDRQLPADEASQSSELQTQTGKVSASLGVLADWWALYGQIYRDDPTEELAIAFRVILKPMLSNPAILNEAMIIAARQSPEFRPKPGRVFEIAEGLLSQRQVGNRPAYLDDPPTPAEEREAAVKDHRYQELKHKLTVVGKQKTP